MQYTADLDTFWHVFPSYTARHSEENPDVILREKVGSICILDKSILIVSLVSSFVLGVMQEGIAEIFSGKPPNPLLRKVEIFLPY